MKNKARFPHRRKQDGSDDMVCLSCFKTLSPKDLEAPNAIHTVEEHDHICAFAFPERRANEITFEDGPKRRKSDMQWQTLIGREAILPSE